MDVVALETNYRCSGRIVEAAGALISNNSARMPKALTPANAAGVHLLLLSTRTRDYSTRKGSLQWLSSRLAIQVSNSLKKAFSLSLSVIIADKMLIC
jgi:hypothetical protein